MIQLQSDFDKRHASSHPFFVPITAQNLGDLEHLVVCLVGEVGEFANQLKKVVRGDLAYDEARAGLSDELADIFIYLMKIASQANIDLESSFFNKLHRNETRFEKWERP